MSKLLCSVGITVFLLWIPTMTFSQAPDLGAASSFALFTAAGAFANNGTTFVSGDIGTNVGAFTGFPPGIVTGNIHVADGVSAQAAADVDAAYMYLNGITCGSVIGTTLGNGQILTPDVYCLGAASVLNGTLTLDGEGDPNAFFLFQIDGALSTSTFANIELINGANLCNVYFQVNGQFTLGDSSIFQGTLVVNGAITLLEASTLLGRALSRAGAISLNNNDVTIGAAPVASIITADGPTTFCEGDGVTISGNVGGVFNTGDSTASITVFAAGDYFVINSNGCGSDTSNVITISLSPNLPPSITCPPNITIECDESTLVANTGMATATDDCNGSAIVTSTDLTIASTQCPQEYTIVRTFIATDSDGNTSSCNQTITIEDSISPVITCPADVTLACTSNTSPGATGTAIAFENCDAPATIVSADIIIPGNCSSSFTILRTFTATDECGNSSSCLQTLNVADAVPPVIICPANVTIQCASMVPTVNLALVVASDNCGGTAVVTLLSAVNSNQTCTNRFTLTRTFKAVDACGNSSTCAQTISVFDNTLPVITCPANITVQCASLVPAVNLALVVASDNCGGTAVVTLLSAVNSNQTCTNRFTLTRTFKAVDACGNSSTCAQTISVFDNTLPVITCPANITVQCASLVPAVNLALVVASDNCGGTAIVTHVGDVSTNVTCVNRFILTRTFRATDACGNSSTCSQQITVFDNAVPSITCPANITVQCADQVPAPNTALVVTTDNCGGVVTVTLAGDVITNQTCTNRFTLTRTYMASDACGNSATCSQIITVFDNTSPVITFTSPLLLGVPNGGTIEVQCFGQDPLFDLPSFNAGSVNAIDNCVGSVSVIFTQTIEDAGNCEEDGYINLYRLSWTATDACGNTSTAFAFMALVDTIPPVILGVPTDITVNCDSVPPIPTLVIASDECLCACVILVEDSEPITGCQDGLVIVRTFTATDACGNVTIETQNITLVDDQGPDLLMLQPEIAGIANGTLLEYTCNEGGIPDFFDSLDGGSMATSFSCGGSSEITFNSDVIISNNCEFFGYVEQRIYTWEATDMCGNQSSMTLTVHLMDDEAPTLIGIPEMTCVGSPLLREIDATDNCGEASVRFWDVNIPNPCGTGTALRRTYEASDDCGNIAVDTVILIPNDLTPPVIEFINPDLIGMTATDTLFVECSSSNSNFTTFGVHDGSAVDGCGQGVTMSFTETLMETGDCVSGGMVAMVQLVWTATDACGNQSSASVMAQVVDQTGPVFQNFSPEVSIGCNDEMPLILASDNCGDVEISMIETIIQGDCAYTYDIQRLVTLTDPCGNKTSQTQIVHVGGQGLKIEGVEETICNDLTIPLVTAYDECADQFVEVTMEEDTLDSPCGDGLLIERIWTAVDICGNESVIRQIIMVNDSTPPEILIPSYSVIRFFMDNSDNLVMLSQTDLINKLNALNEFSMFFADDCNLGILTVFSVDTTFAEDCLTDGFFQRRIYTWIATDICGNSSSISFDVDIMDDTPPVFDGMQQDTTIICAPLPEVPVASAQDPAGPVTILFSETIEPGLNPGEFIVTRKWIATDACGNSSEFIQRILWIPDTFLECNIELPGVIECNSHGVVITSNVTGGNGPLTYMWEIVGEKCFIQGGQGTPDVTIYVGFSAVKVILTVTDSFGCVSMCMITINCVETTQGSLINTPQLDNSVTNTVDGQTSIDIGSYNQGGENFNKFSLWPNPISGEFTIRIDLAEEQNIDLSFTNYLGQVVMADRIKGNKGVNTRGFDVSHLPEGTYVVQLRTPFETLTKMVALVRN